MTTVSTHDELRLESDRRLALSTLAVILTTNLAFLIINLRSAPVALNEIPPKVIVRLVAVLVAAAITAALCAVKTQRALEDVVFAGSLSAVALNLLIQALGPANDPPAVAFNLVLLSALFVALPGRAMIQAISATALCAGTALILFDADSFAIYPFRIQYSIFFVAAFTLGYVSSLRRNELWSELVRTRTARLTAAVEAERARLELQTLHGIIPICSHCQRVRIEDGRLWERVDMYVSKRTDAAFSHGVCPDCLVVHYPGIGPE